MRSIQEAVMWFLQNWRGGLGSEAGTVSRLGIIPMEVGDNRECLFV